MIERSRRFEVFFLLALSAVLAFLAGESYAQDSKGSRAQSETEITVIHVDKYGIYGPNVIFYWDTGMSKQKVDALMKTAEKLRNKKAVVAYSSSGDLKTDKRPLVVDVLTRKDESDYASSAALPKEDASKGAAREEKAARVAEDGAKPEEKAAAKPAPPKEDSGSAGNGAPPDELRLKDYSQKRLYNEEKTPAAPTRQEPQNDKQTAAVRESSPPKPPVKSVESGFEPAEPGSMSKEEIAGMIRRILKLNEMKDLDSIMTFYADQVNYYERGVVTKDYIRKDMGYYFRNWDKINTALDGDVVLIVTDQHDLRIVKYYSVYYVENSKKAVKGRSENVWKIQKINNSLKIVDIKQRIVSSE